MKLSIPYNHISLIVYPNQSMSNCRQWMLLLTVCVWTETRKGTSSSSGPRRTSTGMVAPPTSQTTAHPRWDLICSDSSFQSTSSPFVLIWKVKHQTNLVSAMVKLNVSTLLDSHIWKAKKLLTNVGISLLPFHRKKWPSKSLCNIFSDWMRCFTWPPDLILSHDPTLTLFVTYVVVAPSRAVSCWTGRLYKLTMNSNHTCCCASVAQEMLTILLFFCQVKLCTLVNLSENLWKMVERLV